MTLFEVLPAPIHAPSPKVPKIDNSSTQDLVDTQNSAPLYGHREGWAPRCDADFANGGAFPEIHMAQYPPGFGDPSKKINNAIIKTFDTNGNPQYGSLLSQSYNSQKIIHATPLSMQAHQVDISQIKEPTEEEIQNTTEKTAQALSNVLNRKISTSMIVNPIQKNKEPEYIRYTPAYGNQQSNSGAKQRIIKMTEAKKDPMMPGGFRINKKIPRGPPSPPAPVMHSPTRKLTQKEAQDWKIPPCVSNWKNPRGYTIPLHMRVAADGRGLENVQINENFAKLTESLYIAENNARKAVEYRATIEKKKAQKEKERNEAKLRKLAEQAREELSGMRSEKTNNNDDIEMRDDIRKERARNRQRDRNIRNAAPDKRSKLEKERDRDISEKIALGLPAQTSNTETLYDPALFNRSSGLNSGFVDEDVFNAYDKEWMSDKNISRTIYHPSKNLDEDVYGSDLSKIANQQRFVPDKPFEGADQAQREPGAPVQFEEVFGLDQFLNEVKEGRKR